MSEPNQDSVTGQRDPRAVASAALRRDRGRVRLLAIFTMMLWVIAAATIPAFFLPLRAQIDYELSGLSGAVRAEQLSQIVNALFRMTIFAAGWIIAIALAAAMLASASTVALALAIRRVTLRHVSEQLSQISSELAELKRGD